MSSNIINQVSYLRTSRNFPQDIKELTVELNKSYIDTANAINCRTIGIFPTDRPAIGGEGWYITSQKQQNLRQIYTFTASGNIPHGINTKNISQFTKCSGSYTDGTNWYGTIFGTSTAIAGEVSFYITPTNIVVLSGAGAPAITSGTIVLEWLSKV